TFYLTGDCQPRVLRFEVVNPFRASPTDLRQLGIQLTEVRVDSKFGYPLLVPLPYLQVFLALLLLSLLWYFSLPPSPLRLSALFVPLFGFYIVQSAIYMRLFKIYPLWLLFVFVLLGMVVTRLLASKPSESDQRVGTPWVPLAGI